MSVVVSHRRGFSQRWGPVLARHWGLVTLLAVGFVLRLLVTIAYQPALWYHGDSGGYIDQSRTWVPEIKSFRPDGYPFFLWLLRPTGSFTVVTVVQHLMGLGLAVAAYVFLQRRGVSRLVSCLAVVPVLFDSLQVTLEQFILVETLVTVVLLTSLLILLRRPLTTRAGILAGVVFFGAWFIKPLLLPVLGMAALYLIVRRVGWRRVTGFVVAFLIPYAVVQIWVSGRLSVYGSNSAALYSRAASIADCERIVLPPAEAALCPPLSQRGHRPDWYNWGPGAVGIKVREKLSAAGTQTGFAIDVVRQQPMDYLRVVSKEASAHFVPGIDLGPEYECLRTRFTLPTTARDTGKPASHCHPELARSGFATTYADPESNPPATALTRALHGYSVWTHMAQVALTVATLLTIAAVLLRRRRRNDGDGYLSDAVLLMAVSVVLVVLPVAVGMYEPRYALPVLPLIGMAGALAWARMRAPRRETTPAAAVGDNRVSAA
jgi:hypothetical protein